MSYYQFIFDFPPEGFVGVSNSISLNMNVNNYEESLLTDKVITDSLNNYSDNYKIKTFYFYESLEKFIYKYKNYICVYIHLFFLYYIPYMNKQFHTGSYESSNSSILNNEYL